MFLAWLKLLDPRIWIALALVLATVAVLGYTYHAGWSSANKDHLLYVEREQVILAGIAAKRKETKANADRVIEEKDRERKKAVAAIDSRWKRYLVRELADRTAARPEPVRTAPTICSEPADNDRLSDTVQEYRLGVRDAHEEYRQKVGGLLAVCEAQALDLKLTVEWALEAQRIYGER